jgi:hypothetical protein
VSPGIGPLDGNVQVQVLGRGFLCGQAGPNPNLQVWFGTNGVGYGARTASGTPLIKLATDDQILVDAPSSRAAGTVDVVVATGSCGSTPTTPADLFTYQGECSGTCFVDVNGGATNGPAVRRADSVLEGTKGGFADDTALNATVQYVNGLHLSRWVVASDPYSAQVYSRLSPQPPIEYLMSDAWLVATNEMAPWADGYATWNSFLASAVHGQPFCNQVCVVPPPGPVAFWNVWNEPQTPPKFGASSCNFYDLFRDTYQELHRLAGNPRIIVPSVTELTDFSLPGDDGTGTCQGSNGARADSTNFISMKGLFNWTTHYNATHPPDLQLHFSGYAFHVDNGGRTCDVYNVPGCPVYPLNSPNAVADRVNRMRNLLAQYPTLLPADIEVNEFATPNAFNGVSRPYPGTQMMPGWEAGYISSFEQSNVDSASLACWAESFPIGSVWSAYDQCAKGFGGLLGDDNRVGSANQMDSAVGPQAIYWVYRFYGSMNGVRVATSSQTTDLTSFATRDDSTGTLKVLIGRHKRCSVFTARDPGCPAGGGAANVLVRVAWPYLGTAVRYTLQQIPDTGEGLGGPCPTLPAPSTGIAGLTGGLLVGGTATIRIPTFSDADAYTLTLSPA